MKARSLILSAACLALTPLVASLPSNKSVKSEWLAEEMVVDGRLAEATRLTPITREVAVAAANNQAVLYLALSTGDMEMVQRFRVGGVIVYLDPAGRRHETFGLRLPPLGGDALPGQPATQPDLNYFEVLGPERRSQRIVDVAASGDIAIAVASHDAGLDLELQVPLRSPKGPLYAPNVETGQQVIGLGLATPEPPSRRPSSSNPGGRGNGGLGRGGGLLPPMQPVGRSGGPPDDQDRVRSGKAINTWTTIELAQNRW